MKKTIKSGRLVARKFRGLSLLEAMLALGIGGIVITQSVFGLQRYTSGLQVQAAASKLSILNRAADRYAEDNYSTLVANAPQQIPISVLAPYIGDNIGSDSFGNEYFLTTRTYLFPVLDPISGGTIQEQALQVLIVGAYADPLQTAMIENLTLRSDIAITAGSAAGFIALDGLSCADGAGGVSPDGAICGAFGAYSINSANFPATNFANAAVVSLVTKGDGTVYGDQLYRYDYGDPELNTMRTDLFMDNNRIVDPSEITGADIISMNGAGTSIIRTEDASNLTIESAGSALIRSQNGSITFNSSTNDYFLGVTAAAAGPCVSPSTTLDPCTQDFARLSAENGRLRLNNTETVFGDKVALQHGARVLRTGTGNIWAGFGVFSDILTVGLNSLFDTSTDALRLQQNREFGEVIIGRRVRYTPDGTGGTYELSDGNLTAQHVQVQDISCADCGGSLASILPKWRHMGTYFIPDGTARRVPKPQCTDNRTSTRVRAAIGNDLAYADSNSDARYEAKIILIPRQMAFTETSGGAGVIDFRFDAIDSPTSWLTFATVTGGLASALAKTYCVFTGGNVDPTLSQGDIPNATDPATADPNFVRIE